MSAPTTSARRACMPCSSISTWDATICLKFCAGVRFTGTVVDGKHEVVPTLGAQCIWPQHLPQQSLQPDISSMRYDLSHSLKSMQKQGRWTDLIIQVDSRTWEVHRLVLATCSPFFDKLLQCMTPGTVLPCCICSLSILPECLYRSHQRLISISKMTHLTLTFPPPPFSQNTHKTCKLS